MNQFLYFLMPLVYGTAGGAILGIICGIILHNVIDGAMTTNPFGLAITAFLQKAGLREEINNRIFKYLTVICAALLSITGFFCALLFELIRGMIY